ncbi:MAG: PfkB family carbohydrate kinase [Ignavibacteria bacterium]|nr:PfkB family carbohydrate kinase [Ignavibacteria bacterium]
MKIIVIGHPCIDIIHQNNYEFKSYGGVIYSLIGFLIVAKSDDELIPIFKLDEIHFERYFEIIKKYPQIKKELIEKNQSSLNVVHLFFEGEHLNFECYQSTAPKIEVEKYIRLIPKDTNFYVNMISGFELELDDLKLIRKNFSGKIYFDFHTLTRGMNDEGKRVYRPIENWRDWVSNCNLIQLNEIEMENLTPEKLSEKDFALEALKVGAQVVNITKGEKGATSYFIENDELKEIHIAPEKNLTFKSNVGCGDIFGAVFAYNYFRNENIETCLKEAVKISSRRIEIEKIEDIIEKLKV